MISVATHQDTKRFGNGRASRDDVLRTLGIGLGLGIGFGVGAPRVADAFDPLTDTAGACVAWFDMLDAASYTQAGTVTAVTNKASTVSWTEATNPPDYDATGLNGRPCMVGGTNKLIKKNEAAVAAALANNNAHTIFIACQLVTLSATHALFGVGDSATSGSRVKIWGITTGGTGQYLLRNVDNAVATVSATSGTSTSNTSPNVLEFVVTTSAATIKRNGTALVTGAAFAPSTTTPNQASLFSRPDLAPDSFSDAKIGEVLVYSSALSDGDAANVRAYLGGRWGVTVA